MKKKDYIRIIENHLKENNLEFKETKLKIIPFTLIDNIIINYEVEKLFAIIKFYMQPNLFRNQFSFWLFFILT